MFYVSDERRYVYCATPKVACTSWKHCLLELTGKNLSRLKWIHNVWETDKILKRAVHYGSNQKRQLLKKYYKFMFVRDPLERLVSAFRDKCLAGAYDPYYTWLPRLMRKRQRLPKNAGKGKTTKPYLNISKYMHHCCAHYCF